MKVVLLIIALVLGGLLGTVMVRDAGYVLVTYANTTIETSLWVALFTLLAVAGLIWLLVYLFGRVLRGRSGVSRWIQRRRMHGARQLTVRGLLHMAEGQWAQAKKILENSVARSETPLINYLNAARAAHELGDLDERDRLLRLAHETTPGSRFAVLLTQARLQKDKGQWEQCLATLIQLKNESPRHPLVLTMLLDCYRALEDWSALAELIPSVRKAKVVSADDLRAAQVELWQHRMGSSRDSDDLVTHVAKTYSEVPKGLKNDVAIVAMYARLLHNGGADDEAEAVLRKALRGNWQDEWARLYGLVRSSDPERQLATAESWLRERPRDGVVLLTLGRICLMREDWTQAREYLEASIEQCRSAEACAELGRLCLALGESERGSDYLSQSVDDDRLVRLPVPTTGALAAVD